MDELNTLLQNLRTKVRDIQTERTRLRSHAALEPTDLGNVSLSSAVNRVMAKLVEEVEKDSFVFASPPPAEGDAPSPEGEDITPETEESPPLQPASPLPQDQLDLPAEAYTAHWVANLKRTLIPRRKVAEDESLDKRGRLPPPTQRLYDRVARETKRMADGLDGFGPLGLGTLQKIRKAEAYLLDNNIGSALRLLKDARGSDPHNNTLAYILSQTEYFQVMQGHKDALPDARNEARKSGAISDTIDQRTLQHYRYDAIACERPFSDKKALEWLQEFYLLDPEQTGGQEGLLKHDGMHLKGWLTLSTISADLWNDYVFSSLDGLIKNTVGGVTLYLHLFRPKIVQEIKTRPVPPANMQELEMLIGKSYTTYKKIHDHFQKYWATPLPKTWTVRNRYLSAFREAAPLPTFDEVFLHIALSGRSYEHFAYPVDNLHARGMDKDNYWRLWAVALAPETEGRISNLLPVEETGIEHAFYGACAQILDMLKQEEQKRIDTTTWNEAKPKMSRFSIDHLLAVATRSQNPRQNFAPTTQPFNHYYHAWIRETPKEILPSTLIDINSANGAFGSCQEVLVTLEGAASLIDDPHYGIKAQQKAALSTEKKGRFPLTAFQADMGVGQMITYIFLPLAAISFVAFVIMSIF
jgi:hypothetical protein